MIRILTIRNIYGVNLKRTNVKRLEYLFLEYIYVIKYSLCARVFRFKRLLKRVKHNIIHRMRMRCPVCVYVKVHYYTY